MQNERACANGPAIPRRTLLATLPASGVALALPDALSAQSHDTEILRLFRQHQEIKEASRVYVTTAAGSLEDEEMFRLFYRHTDQIEDEMMALPSTCAADMAAKMILVHLDGEFSCVSWDDPVWIEARQLVAPKRH